MQRDEKVRLRAELMAVRQSRTATEIETARAAVRSAVLTRCAQKHWRTVAAYVPLRTEPGSVELLDDLRRSGVRVLLPVLLDDADLDWTYVSALDAVVAETLGVEAIATADAVLVPALAVASDGTRLGRGGGSYDRALARAGEVPVAALLFDGELRERLPSEPWDRRVSAVVQPSGWRDLG